MKHAIITCSDEIFGDFLVDHWLQSLKENVNLKNIDVIVIDYGLTKKQVKKLKDNNVLVYKCIRDGFPNSIKFRDISNFLSSRRYDQIMTCDGGDIIFQTDISGLFEKNKNTFRTVCETFNPFLWRVVKKGFNHEDVKKIIETLKKKKLTNVGVLIGPYTKFKKLCDECSGMMKSMTFGPDTFAVNYILYRDGFKVLDQTYNFITTNTSYKFYIKDGVFYLKNGKKIKIVHNAGGISFVRPIKNFGYGPDNNKLKPVIFFAVKWFIKLKQKKKTVCFGNK